MLLVVGERLLEHCGIIRDSSSILRILMGGYGIDEVGDVMEKFSLF